MMIEEPVRVSDPALGRIVAGLGFIRKVSRSCATILRPPTLLARSTAKDAGNVREPVNDSLSQLQ